MWNHTFWYTHNTHIIYIYIISNFSHENTVRQIDNILKFTKSERINNIFNDCNTMIAYKQPHNILRHVTKAAFTSIPPTISDQPQNGLFRCKRPNCKLCSLYIQECASFITANGYEWEIRCHIDCHSVNVLYYLKCLSYPDPLNPVTYTGKTYLIRDCMNVHISSCRLGGSSDKFDNMSSNVDKNTKIAENHISISTHFSQLRTRNHLKPTKTSFIRKDSIQWTDPNNK